jgi:hypothetical protein
MRLNRAVHDRFNRIELITKRTLPILILTSFIVVVICCSLSGTEGILPNANVGSASSRKLLQNIDKTRLAIINHMPDAHPTRVLEKAGIAGPENLVKHIAAVNHMPVQSVADELSAPSESREMQVERNSANEEAMPPGISSVKYLTVSSLAGPVSDPPEIIDGQQSDWWW